VEGMKHAMISNDSDENQFTSVSAADDENKDSLHWSTYGSNHDAMDLVGGNIWRYFSDFRYLCVWSSAAETEVN